MSLSDFDRVLQEIMSFDLGFSLGEKATDAMSNYDCGAL